MTKRLVNFFFVRKRELLYMIEDIVHILIIKLQSMAKGLSVIYLLSFFKGKNPTFFLCQKMHLTDLEKNAGTAIKLF